MQGLHNSNYLDSKQQKNLNSLLLTESSQDETSTTLSIDHSPTHRMGTSAHSSAQNIDSDFTPMQLQYDNLKAQLMQPASNPDKSLAAENSREPPFEVIVQPSNTSPSQQCDATVCLCNHKGLRPTDSDPPLQDLMMTMPSV